MFSLRQIRVGLTHGVHALTAADARRLFGCRNLRRLLLQAVAHLRTALIADIALRDRRAALLARIAHWHADLYEAALANHALDHLLVRARRLDDIRNFVTY